MAQFDAGDFEKLELMLAKPRVRFSVDDAMDLIARIYAHIESVEDFRLKLKWCLGQVTVHLDCPPRRRQQTIAKLSDRLWEERGIKASVSTLYESAAVVRSFDGQLMKFEAWIGDTKEIFKRPIFWSDIQRLILGGRNNARIIGQEAADQRDIRAIEEGTAAIDSLMMRDGNWDRAEAVHGTLEAFRQSVEAMAHSKDRKNQAPRSDRYRAFVGKHGCVVCERAADAHHAFGRRGTSSKSSDFTCVPLCREHHRICHQLGLHRFEDKFDVHLVEVAFNLLHRFFTGTWATMVLPET